MLSLLCKVLESVDIEPTLLFIVYCCIFAFDIRLTISRLFDDKFVFHGISKSGNNVLTLILEDIDTDKKFEDEIKEDIFSFVSLDSFLELHSHSNKIRTLPTPKSILR